MEAANQGLNLPQLLYGLMPIKNETQVLLSCHMFLSVTKNHDQTLKVSSSTIAKTIGKIQMLPFCVIVIKSIPGYLPFKNVPSICTTSLWKLKALQYCFSVQNSRWNIQNRLSTQLIMTNLVASILFTKSSANICIYTQHLGSIVNNSSQSPNTFAIAFSLAFLYDTWNPNWLLILSLTTKIGINGSKIWPHLTQIMQSNHYLIIKLINLKAHNSYIGHWHI